MLIQQQRNEVINTGAQTQTSTSTETTHPELVKSKKINNNNQNS